MAFVSLRETFHIPLARAGHIDIDSRRWCKMKGRIRGVEREVRSRKSALVMHDHMFFELDMNSHPCFSMFLEL